MMKIKKIILTLVLTYSLPVCAKVYECNLNGKVEFQSRPCSSATVGDARPDFNKSIPVITDLSKIHLETYSLNFSECKKHVLKMQLAANKQSFKTIALQNDTSHYSVKVCTTDRSIVMSCDGMKRKMHLRRKDACE